MIEPDGRAGYHKRGLVVDGSDENVSLGIFCLMNRDARRKIAVKVIFPFNERWTVREVF
jgi:hypothetical protein